MIETRSHQDFNGERYFKREKRGYYYSKHKKALHNDIWIFFHGEIPKGCVIHHANENKEDNGIINLLCWNGVFHAKYRGRNRSPELRKQVSERMTGRIKGKYKKKKVSSG